MLCEWSKLTLFQCGGSNLTWFQCGMNGFGSCWVVENDLISVWWINIDLVLCSGQKFLIFSVRIEIKWVFVSRHRNELDIRVGIKIDMISVMGVIRLSLGRRWVDLLPVAQRTN